MLGKLILTNKYTEPSVDGFVTCYIGRGSPFGNIYTHSTKSVFKGVIVVGSRDEAVKNHKEYFMEKFKTDKSFRAEIFKIINMLRDGVNVNLQCFCLPKRCHGQFIKLFIEQIIIKLEDGDIKK